MPRCQYKKTVNTNQDSMSPPEPSYPTTANPEYSNMAKAQENDPRTSFTKIIDVHREEMNKPLNESQENTNWRRITHLLKKPRKKQVNS